MTPFYERWGSKLGSLPLPSRKVARFIDGHVYRGHADMSRQDNARRWRLFWRIKVRRTLRPQA